MNKFIRDKQNALKSKLAELKTPKLTKQLDTEKIKQLEKELENLNMKIVKIEKINSAIFVTLDNGEFVVFHKFGNDVYSVISENLEKKYFNGFKKDIIKTNWNVEELTKKWIEPKSETNE